MIETVSLLPGAELTCCRDTRFKQGCLSVQLVRPMKADEAAMNALIPSILLRGTRKHRDLRSITMALDDLYGAAVSPLVRRVGDYGTTGLYCSFMDSRFAMPGDKVLEPMIAFVRELLLDYPTRSEGFLKKYTESEKKNLISTLEAELNDKQVYASKQLMKHMCSRDSLGIPRLGEKEDVAAADASGLLAHYRSILSTGRIRFFYAGSEEPARIAALLTPILDLPGRAPEQLPPQTGYSPAPPCDITETMEIAQGKLCIGMTTPITNRDPRFAAMQVLNTLYGSGMTSKLFMNLREKQSLCYSIGSGYYGSKGILTVSAGIDSGKREIAEAGIQEQLDCCRRGEITEEELNAAKEALISGLRAAHDSPGAIESYYSTAALSGLNLTPEAYIDAVRAVTAAQVAEAAQTVSPHSTYFLKGAAADEADPLS